jgi:D-alanyl-D-alanine carboxypeptidase (penicillin-binding protein 5/6)
MAGTRRTWWVWIVFTAVIGAMLITAATVVAVRLTAPEPATVNVHVQATLLVDGKAPPPIPVPAQGSFALATSLDGMVANRDATAVRPIGSVAKAMTALVVLAAHPLELNASGPSITMTNTDVQLYRQAVAEGGSNLPVHAGEVFTERNLLLALLLPSADNIAESLALWVSGNRSAFIARLNATAAAMGMHHTHFADPSGLSDRTVSTAADLVLLARAVIANSALASVVGTVTTELPDGTVLKNLDILLSQQDGWLGIKTGWTGAAGGCLLFADQTFYETGQVITVWGAVLGQPPDSDADPAHPELGEAFASAQNAVVAAIATYASVDIAASAPQVSGSVSTKWGASTLVQLYSHAPVFAFVRAGTVLRLHLSVLTLRAPLSADATVAQITGVLNPKTSVTWKVISGAAVAGPSVWWKLFSG